MFGLGGTEMMLILVIALVVIGPKKLPEIAKSLGKGFAEFKRGTEDIKQSFSAGVSDEEKKATVVEPVQPAEVIENKEENPAVPPEMDIKASDLEEAELVNIQKEKKEQEG